MMRQCMIVRTCGVLNTVIPLAAIPKSQYLSITCTSNNRYTSSVTTPMMMMTPVRRFSDGPSGEGRRGMEVLDGTVKPIDNIPTDQLLPKWTMSSYVKDILLHRVSQKKDVKLKGESNREGEIKLKDFVKQYLDEDLPNDVRNVPMSVVVTNPRRYIPEELREMVESLEPFQVLHEARQEAQRVRQEAQQAQEDVHVLNKHGIVTLEQWKASDKKDSVSLFSQGILNGVHTQVTMPRETPQEGVVMTGLYESVENAKWDHVVRSPKSSADRLWIDVREGRPSKEWSDEEVKYLTQDEPEEPEEDDNIQPTRECMQMMVLTSEMGWPYKSVGTKPTLDTYITKEVERAWRYIKDDLYDMFDDTSMEKSTWCRILIGTPGIGKSMAAGSYLLYNLLHYDAKRISIVAYFIDSDIYIFDKNQKQVTKYGFAEGLTMIGLFESKGRNGYIIYDCSKRVGEPPRIIAKSWGILLISSPNEKNFKEWEKHNKPDIIVMNCPTIADIKAMYMWRQRNNNDTNKILSEWKAIEMRVEDLGPLLRYIFDLNASNKRLQDINTEIDCIICGPIAIEYLNMHNYNWDSEYPCHKLMKIYRSSINKYYRTDGQSNDYVSGRISARVIQRMVRIKRTGLK